MSPISRGLALLATIGLAQAQNITPPPIPKFEVASIKPCKIGPGRRRATSSPGRLNTGCVPLVDNNNFGLIQRAYVGFAGGKRNPDFLLITGGPNWIRSETYDIKATVEGSPSTEMMEGPMLQALLEDRFRLKLHRETKEGDVYALTLLRDDSKLKRWQEGSCALRPSVSVLPVDGEHQRVCHIGLSMGGPGQSLLAEGSTIEEFSKILRFALDRPIIDKTGLAGRFDIRLNFSADATTPGLVDKGPDGQQTASEPTGATLFGALQKQLGLKLAPTKGPIEVLVIDHIERPSEN